MEGAGMLVVSLRGVNFRFWSRLGCSGQNTIIFSPYKSLSGLHSKKYKKLYIFNLFYDLLLTRFMSSKFKMIAFRGQKRLGHAQIGLLQGYYSKFPTSIPASLYGSRESPTLFPPPPRSLKQQCGRRQSQRGGWFYGCPRFAVAFSFPFFSTQGGTFMYIKSEVFNSKTSAFWD